jgi:N-acetylmuramoyl-L-alanine amidase
MTTVKPRTHWLKILLIVPLIIAFSFSSVAFAQEDEQQTAQGDEIFQREFATVEQRQQARQRDLTAFDNPTVRDRWCNADDWIVREGESLGLIVLRCGISLDHLLAVNPQISDPDLVYVGEIVNLPDQEQRRMAVGVPGFPARLNLTAAQFDYMQGLFAQAEAEGIPITGADAEDIGTRNIAPGHMQNAARQRDLARFDDPNYRAQWCDADEWVMAPGESLSTIVMRCGIPLEAILAVNPQISNGNIVISGEMITLPDEWDAQTMSLTPAQHEYIEQNFDTSPGAGDDDDEG